MMTPDGIFMDYSVVLGHLKHLFIRGFSMRRLSSPLLLALVPLALIAGTAHASVEKRVRDMVEAGEIVPFETIRSRVAGQVRGDYIGVQFDEPTLTYRFRFMVDGELINVDVDARTGQRRRTVKSY